MDWLRPPIHDLGDEIICEWKGSIANSNGTYHRTTGLVVGASDKIWKLKIPKVFVSSTGATMPTGIRTGEQTVAIRTELR